MIIIYRQGDILITPVDKVPKGLKRVPLENNRVVLAHGEVTGHAHAIDDCEAQLLAADLQELDEMFLRIEAEHARAIDAWECRNSRGETCWIPAYTQEATVEAADLKIIGRASVKGVVVEHEEHLHQVITPGDYRVERQREYSPEEIRTVAD